MSLSGGAEVSDGRNTGISFPSHSGIEKFLNFANSEEAERWQDVTIIADRGKSLRCHRLMLSAHCHYLMEALGDAWDAEESTVTIIAPDVDVKVLEAALEFMYKGIVSADNATMVETDNLFHLGEQRRRASSHSRERNPDSGRRRVGRKKRLKQKSSGRLVVDDEDLEDYECCGHSFASRVDLEDHKKSSCASENKEQDEVDADDEKGTERKARTRSERLRTSSRKRHAPKRTSPLSCCNTLYDDEAVLASHKENVHLEKMEKDRYMICCNEKIFGNLMKHLESEHSLDKASERANCCDDTFDGVEAVTKHCTTRHGLRVTTFKRVVCCAQSLADVEEYLRHKEQDDAHVECNHCTFLSKDERHVNLHMYNKHRVTADEDDESSIVSAAYACKHCSMSFNSVMKRQRHEDEHEDSPKYPCGSCGKRFKLMSSLKSHLYRMGKNHNPAEKMYACDSCDRVFQSIVAKRKHHRTEHQKKDAYLCDVCDLAFVDKHRLNTHVKSVHLKVKDVQCTFCGKMFATQERMKIHEKFVHVVEVEKVLCDICSKPFQNKERMFDHRRSVHRDRKYQCDECGSTFKNSSTLKSHVVSIHLEHDKKPLKCTVCGKGFLHESRRKAHMLIHSDTAPFSCQYCGRPNKCKNNNLKHEKRCKKATSTSTRESQALEQNLPATQVLFQVQEDSVTGEVEDQPEDTSKESAAQSTATVEYVNVKL